MKFIKQIIQAIKNFFYNRKVKKLTKKVTAGARAKNQDRLKLEYLIKIYIKRFLKKSPHNKSEYIPLTSKERQLIMNSVEKEFGKQLQQLNVTFNDKFQLV